MIEPKLPSVDAAVKLLLELSGSFPAALEQML
jgi:hypothetical protein